REDLRRMPVITIDPDDAKDFDDAIHVERLPNGGWRLGVHIADVSHYVRPGRALDKEARLRGNSTYLADRVIPMLPERLSNGICSLRPDEDRLTSSAFIEFSSGGKIKSARFAKTVIRSAARLTYKQAFAVLQGGTSGNPGIDERVHVAWELASLLRKNRYAAGSLDLDFPEVKVRLDENGKAVRLEKIENDISHQLIEECMLAANEVVAREIKGRQQPSIYRIHEDPDPDRLSEYREQAATYGFKAGDLTQRREVQKLLAAIKGKPEEYALKIGFLKSLKRAAYDTRPLGHYGLAKVNYTHFTSPIRRYADLVVHRVLAQQRGPSVAEFGATALHISTTERTSADAEKDSVQLKKMEFFQRQLESKRPEEMRAAVVDVRSYGLVVELPDVLVSGLIHVSSLPGDFYMFDPVRLAFTGRKTKRRYKIGDELRVIVSRVDAYKRQIDFVPVG
ncbi:MAG TPA: VacB/RNase II family 3'-5' exoribonuclease, partial [Chthoniobacteraceae bacterium]